MAENNLENIKKIIEELKLQIPKTEKQNQKEKEVVVEEKSVKKDANAKSNKKIKNNGPEVVTKNTIDQLEEFIQQLLFENNRLKEEKLIAIADNQNTVRRYQQESMNVKKYGGQKLAEQIIPAIDLFRGVLSQPTDNPDVKNYLVGFEFIIKQIDEALSNAGVHIIETKIGDEFDHNIHEANEQVETEAVASGRIAQVIQNGYRLHDRVIKYAVVKVAK